MGQIHRTAQGAASQSGGGDRPVYLWVPTGFEPMAYVDRARWADLARFLMHRVVYGNVFRQRDEAGFVRLLTRELMKFFPRKDAFYRIMDALRDGGALVRDGYYVVGEKAYGYRLGPQFEGTKHRRVEVGDRTLARKMMANRQDHARTPDGIHRHMAHWLERVEFDHAGAMGRIFAGGPTRSGHPFDHNDVTAVEMLRDRVLRWVVCPYGRFHTNITSLRTELRAFLSYCGEALVNLDIRNSQPLLFALLLRERYGPLKGSPADVRHYVDLCERGLFYDHLMAREGIPADRRAEFKEQFFGRVFFCPPHWGGTESRAFDREFPNVARLARDLKTGPDPDSYANLSRRLQRAESDLIIGQIATRVGREMPEAFFLTVHDSFLCLERDALAIKTIMLQEFEWADLHPAINLEPTQSTHPF